MINKTFIAERLKISKFEDFLEFPLYYEIETINACNAACEMCTINKWQRHKDPLMSDDLFGKIAEELIQYKEAVRTVNLCRDGEPLMDKKLEQKINLLKNGGIRHVNFSTNASLLSEERAHSLIDTELDEIMFSIDGATKATFEYIRKGLDFDKVVGNVQRFIAIRDARKSRIKIRVRLVIQQENAHEVDSWGAFWRKYVGSQDGVHAKNIHSWGNQLDNFISAKEYKKLITPCTSPFSTMIIRYNGDVTICPLDFDFRHINGNLNSHSIKDVWQMGGFYKQFRDIHMDGKRDEFEFCKGCRLWDADESKRAF